MTVSSTSTLSSLLAQSSATGGSSAATGTSGSQNLSETFLKLLVAQMNNQDPLNPVDNSQVTSQMAQISTVTGISTLNGTVSQLVSQLEQNQAVQSAQMAGRTVLVPGNSLALQSTGATAGSAGSSVAYGGFNLAQAADSVTVTVRDSTGATVRTLNLGAMQSGIQDFTWDGTTGSGAQAATGSYTYSVAAQANGRAVATTAYSAQPVIGVVPQAGGAVQFQLGNGTQVGFSSIAQIL
jgi:flagellar basal-body rod modification protein FlgD